MRAGIVPAGHLRHDPHRIGGRHVLGLGLIVRLNGEHFTEHGQEPLAELRLNVGIRNEDVPVEGKETCYVARLGLAEDGEDRIHIEHARDGERRGAGVPDRAPLHGNPGGKEGADFIE